MLSLPLAPVEADTGDDGLPTATGAWQEGAARPKAALAGVRSALASAGITWGAEGTAHEAVAREAVTREVAGRAPLTVGGGIDAGRTADLEAVAEPAAAQALATGISGIRILVVDDEQDTRDLIRALLADAGAQVDAAASADEAMRLLQASRYDVLVSDVGMPAEDGYSLLRRLRAMPSGAGGETPALALTAYAAPDDRQRALQAGFDLHVAKPVDPADLLAGIARLASRG